MITLPAANIRSGTAFSTTLPSGSYSGIGLAQTIRLQGSSPILQYSGGGSFPVTSLGVQIASMNGVSLLGSFTPIDLTTSPQPIYTSLLALGGSIQLSYTIPVSGYAWAAGTYTTTLTYTLTNTLGASVSNPGLLTITVPSFITAPATLPAFTLNVNNLNDYSTQTVSASGPMAISSSIPYKVGISANNSTYTYNTTLGLATPSNLSVTNTMASLNNGTPAALSASTQNLTPAAIAVSTGNNQTQTLGFSLTPAVLLNQFVQTGTYTVSLTLSTSDASASPVVPSQTTTSSLTVNVADMQSFLVNDPTTTLSFTTAANYQNGLSQSQASHLSVSSTSPWGLAVSTSSASLFNGANTIPVNFISIGNPAGQTLLSAVTLSPTSQTLCSSRPAAIAQTIGVTYTVSAANARQLISLPSGTYATTVTYTLSAL
jgi:hypothetical protein